MGDSGLVIIGAGGFGREVLDLISARNHFRLNNAIRIVGVVDDHPKTSDLDQLRKLGVVHLGNDAEWFARSEFVPFVVAIGDPHVRSRIVTDYESRGYSASEALVHPRAVVGSNFAVAEGTVICAGAQISTNVKIDRHVHINSNATIGHDVKIADIVSVNPAAVVSGRVVVGGRTLIGANSVVLQELSVGRNAVVGAGACVVKNVETGTVVAGVPARII